MSTFQTLPILSPEFYTLGPLQFVNKDKSIVFQEAREWQIASDAVWYNSQWSFRKPITIDGTKVPSAQTNFPVLINLTSDNELKANARSDGFDILFTSSDGSTKIPAEREKYTSGTGALVMWVKVSSLAGTPTDTVIYMYYGNASSCDQTASACDATNNSTAVWDSNYTGVWHMNDGTAATNNDSTSLGRDATKLATTQPNALSGSKIGDGQTFNDATSDKSTVTDNNDFSPSVQPVSVDIWARIPVGATSIGTGACSNTGAFFFGKNDPSQGEYMFENDTNSLICIVALQLTGSTWSAWTYTQAMNDGAWHMYTVQFNYNTTLGLLVDSVARGSQTSAPAGTMGNGTSALRFGTKMIPQARTSMVILMKYAFQRLSELAIGRRQCGTMRIVQVPSIPSVLRNVIRLIRRFPV